MNTLTRRLVLVALTVSVSVVSAALLASRVVPSGAVDAEPGPTARASVRSLVTTLQTSGTVDRVDQRLITFASATNGLSSVSDDLAPGTPAPAQDQEIVDGSARAPSAQEDEAGEEPATQEVRPVVEEEVAATVTSLLGVGAAADRGTVLYAADDEPTVALFGAIPAWRTLAVGVEPGGDVRQLEENLTALGFGSGITVDNAFTTATATQVRAWEASVGRKAPDGIVEVGDVVFLSGAGVVLAHVASVGDRVDPGDPMLRLGSKQLVVNATIDARDAAVWSAGRTAALTWDNGESSQATVLGVSREVADGTVEVVIALGDGDAGRPSGSPVMLEVADAERHDAVAVPVSAVVASPAGGDAVRVPAVGGAGDRIVPVTLGVVADGWAEITDGIEAGEAVRLPG